MKTSPVSGLGSWLIQRVTAVYLLFFFLFVLAYFAMFPATSYQEWRDATSGAGFIIGTSVFFVALLIHAWVGLRDVIMDYVKPAVLRFTVLTLLAGGLIFMAAWSLHVLYGGVG
jgi:succinate dehydrogenase / fumarate reductase membrane anchor subunit